MRDRRPDVVQPRTPAVRSAGALRFFLLVWLPLATAATGWAVATPLFASPDEDAQVVKAVSVARGQLDGDTRV